MFLSGSFLYPRQQHVALITGFTATVDVRKRELLYTIAGLFCLLGWAPEILYGFEAGIPETHITRVFVEIKSNL